MSYKLLNQDIINRDLLFGELWNISADGMLITDEQGEILLVNEACCKILNMKEDDLYGNNFTIALQLPDQENETEQYKNLVRNELTKHQIEKKVTLWNGKKLWLEFSNTNLILPDQKKKY